MNSKPKAKRFIVKRINRASGVVHEHIITVDAEDAYLLRNSFWFVQHDPKENKCYVMRRIAGGGVESIQRVILGVKENERVDHIDGDTMNNRKANLLRSKDRVVELDE